MSEEKQPRKASSIRRTRAIQRDHTKHSISAPSAEEIQALAKKLRLERLVYRGDQFRTIRKFLHLPKNNPLMDNALVKEGQKLARRILPKKKAGRRKLKRSLVE